MAAVIQSAQHSKRKFMGKINKNKYFSSLALLTCLYRVMAAVSPKIPFENF